jgi:hypothetical protein
VREMMIKTSELCIHRRLYELELWVFRFGWQQRQYVDFILRNIINGFWPIAYLYIDCLACRLDLYLWLLRHAASVVCLTMRIGIRAIDRWMWYHHLALFFLRIAYCLPGVSIPGDHPCAISSPCTSIACSTMRIGIRVMHHHWFAFFPRIALRLSRPSIRRNQSPLITSIITSNLSHLMITFFITFSHISIITSDHCIYHHIWSSYLVITFIITSSHHYYNLNINL